MTTEKATQGVKEYAKLNQQLNELMATDIGSRIAAVTKAIDEKKKELYELAKEDGFEAVRESGYVLTVGTRASIDMNALLKAHGDAIVKACPEAMTIDQTKFKSAQKKIAELSRKSASQKDVLGISIEKYAMPGTKVPSIRKGATKE